MDDRQLLDALIRLVSSEPSGRGLMAKGAALLSRERPHFNWVGVYLLQGDTLVLGPFVGPATPHVRIPVGQGICGAAAESGQTIVVDDVEADPRYLACSLETRSEIVVPILRSGQVLGEIDVDSDRPAAFSDADRVLLEAVAKVFASRL